MAEVYLHAKIHVDPSNRLATVHQCHRQDRQESGTDNGPIAQGEPFYKRSPKKGSPYPIGPLSELFVTLVYCGQTVGWIMPLRVEIGLGPGYIVLDGDPAPREGAQYPPRF